MADDVAKNQFTIALDGFLIAENAGRLLGRSASTSFTDIILPDIFMPTRTKFLSKEKANTVLYWTSFGWEESREKGK